MPKLLGVKIDDIRSSKELENTLDAFLNGEKTNIVFTPNPEILLFAYKNPVFRETLNAADLSLPDGFGLKLICFLKHKKPIKRQTGIDTAELLTKIAAERGMKIVFVGGKNNAAEKAAENLKKRLPEFQIKTFGNDINFDEGGEGEGLNEEIKNFAPQIIFVGLGAPKQENWIIKNKDNFSSTRVIMAVGGAFDIWAGRLRRAPKIFRALGLEWLWRLMLEPKRLKRIANATLKFPVAALFKK